MTSPVLVEHLKCPICLEIPEAQIFQCKNGHMFCRACGAQLKSCPQCRVPLGTDKIRNRTLEQLLDVLDFKCPNNGLGCDQVLKRGQLSTHLKYCKFESFYFCKLIGFQSCHFGVAEKAALDNKALLAHLNEAHAEIEESYGSHLRIKYHGFQDRIKSLEKDTFSIWTPHLVKLFNEDDEEALILLFLCQISEVTKNVAWVCLAMAGNSSSLMIEFKLGGISCDDKNSDDLLIPTMAWKAPVLNFQDIDKDLENYALRVPFCVIEALHSSSQVNSLEMEINILTRASETYCDDSIISVSLKELTSFVSRAVKRPEADDNEEEEIVFEGVYCNACYKRPVTNIRYKCLQCIDYDLCINCMEHRIHSHHVFARIHDLRQNGFFNVKQRIRIMKGKSSYIE